MALHSNVHVRRIKTRSDGNRWLATFREGDTIRKRFFKVKKAADEFKSERESETAQTGATVLTAKEKASVLDARQELASFGASVGEALEYFLQHKRQAQQSCSVRK